MANPREGLSCIGGYKFSDAGLYDLALLHSSRGLGRGGKSNERLEFLGDRVLGLVIAGMLYERFPEGDEGELSLRLSRLVDKDRLWKVGHVLGIEEKVRAGRLEEEDFGIHKSLLADAMEAMVGAVYLDGGWEAVRRFVLEVWKDEIEEVCNQDVGEMKDPKTRLQEYCQKFYGSLPVYRVVREEGAAHEKFFEIEVFLEKAGVVAKGEGSSKKRAELEAARGVLLRLEALEVGE